MPHETAVSGTGGITSLENLRRPGTFVEASDDSGGTFLFGLIAFAAVVVVLVAALGLPYQETWHGRWGNSDR